MNANEIGFGIEIETHLPAGQTPIGPYHQGVQVPWLPAGWKAERDSSIRASRYDREQCEFISPVLRGAEGIQQVLTALKAIKDHGARVNDSCGLHITLTFPASDRKALERLVHLVANHEKAIFASTGTKRRERGFYSRPMHSQNTAAAAQTAASQNRFHILNLTHVQRGSNRIEIRAFAGTLNATKIIGYIRLCLALVEKVLSAKRTTKFIAKTPVETSPIHRSGVGQTELTRLFYALGWTKGRTKQVYGNVTAERAPTINACKKELMKLARKYDSQP